jgi:threonine dehydrogenase-like Zn-dependent dehydrogenase
MKAVAVYPADRQVRLIERAEPRIALPTQVRIRMIEVGVCGTDKELCNFVFGTPPPGSDHFILGHESLGEVDDIGPAVTGLQPGDLVVSSVRLPCASPNCPACRLDHQDFCSTGAYIEHGIKGLDGFMAEYVVQERRYLHPVPQHLRDVAVLVEPLTIAEKGFHELERVQSRLPWEPTDRTALILGAGAVGLLGAMKLISAGYRVFIYSLLPASNPSSAIAEAIGAVYISSQITPVHEMAEQVGGIDVVYEALGAAQLAFDVWRVLAPNGAYIFTGVPRHQTLGAFATADIIENLVMKNQAVFGIVNAGPQAFTDAIRDIAIFESRWPDALRSLITDRYAMEAFLGPVSGRAGGIKNVIRIG